MHEEENPFKEKFQEIKSNLNDITCLLNMLIIAINNDFDAEEIKLENISDYAYIMKSYIDKQANLLEEFLKQLDLPDGKTKLLLLRHDVFKKD